MGRCGQELSGTDSYVVDNDTQAPSNPDNQPDHDPATCDGNCGIQHDSWQSLPTAERRDYVLSEVAAGRWLALLRQPVDSDLLDVVASVRAIRSDDYDALSLILANGNVGGMLIASLKMLSEQAAELSISPDFMAVWGSWALARSS
jgi:hypothetical protein